jgi:hypothetical protein
MVKVGVEREGKIHDTQMTSSSHYASAYSAKNGRLNGKSAWCPAPAEPRGKIPESKAWLQINLVISHFICKIAVQGSPVDNEWVTMYRLSYSMDERNWIKEEVSHLKPSSNIETKP